MHNFLSSTYHKHLNLNIATKFEVHAKNDQRFAMHVIVIPLQVNLVPIKIYEVNKRASSADALWQGQGRGVYDESKNFTQNISLNEITYIIP